MVEARAGSLTGSLVEARKGGCGKSEIVRAYIPKIKMRALVKILASSCSLPHLRILQILRYGYHLVTSIVLCSAMETVPEHTMCAGTIHRVKCSILSRACRLIRKRARNVLVKPSKFCVTIFYRQFWHTCKLAIFSNAKKSMTVLCELHALFSKGVFKPLFCLATHILIVGSIVACPLLNKPFIVHPPHCASSCPL